MNNGSKGEIQYLKGEDWKPFGNYLVSNYGRVYSLFSKRMLTPALSKSHYKYYYTVSLSDEGKRTIYRLHRLVAQLFIPNPSEKAEVHHIDCDTLNNKVDNLQWVTAEEHREIHKELRKKGSEHGDEYKGIA